jgi:hypothetical protein
MAEKPVNPPLPCPLGKAEGPNKDAELSDVIEALETGTAIRNVPQLVQTLKALQGSSKSQETAQKRAAETGQVDLVAANEWLESHWQVAKRPCSVCGQEQWGIGPNLAQIPTSALGPHNTPRTSPCVLLVCGNCGNTLFFNAIVMGLLAGEK